MRLRAVVEFPQAGQRPIQIRWTNWRKVCCGSRVARDASGSSQLLESPERQDQPNLVANDNPMEYLSGELFPVEPAELLPHPCPHPRLYLGTSSWTFPGWGGVVYANTEKTERLSRAGLAAYATHPLFNAVALDRTFYAPLPAQRFREYAAEVPDNFRFLVKAPAELVQPASPTYLDAGRARQALVTPAIEGLGSKLLTLHFLFVGRQPDDFVPRLERFLSTLPDEAHYSVELRRPDLLTRDYVETLSRTGASHAWNIIRPMPREQPVVGPLRLVRWHLGSPENLREAAQRYLPFDRIQEPHPETHEWLARQVRSWLEAGETVMVLINNKAEGCAPRSVQELARRLTL